MQKIDRISITEVGIPGMVLMERAAYGVFLHLTKQIQKNNRILIVVESGNNGADGVALARMLHLSRYMVEVYYIDGVKNSSESFLNQLSIAKACGVSFIEDFQEVKTKEYDVIVDAIFGVGLKREVTGKQKEVILELNQKKGLKVTIDIPSGIDATTGQILGCGFCSDITYTMGLLKRGLLLYPGNEYVKEIKVLDIGFPNHVVEQVKPDIFTYSKKDIVLPERKAHSNKGTYGKVAIFAGSKNMAGAAYLAGRAAYLMGTGLVKIITLEENREILQALLPQAILSTYHDAKEAILMIEEAGKWCDTILFGPGVSVSACSEEGLKAVLQLEGKKQIVIDADGINLLSKHIDLLKESPHNIILTPHLKEMSRLNGQTVEEIERKLVDTAVEVSSQYSVTVVLKSFRTIVTNQAYGTYINTTGNSGLAKGGSGDVLAGMIAGLLAVGVKQELAPSYSVYLHGKAAEAATKWTSEATMEAEDILKGIKKVIK